jgi:hypothetical protein
LDFLVSLTPICYLLCSQPPSWGIYWQRTTQNYQAYPGPTPSPARVSCRLYTTIGWAEPSASLKPTMADRFYREILVGV